MSGDQAVFVVALKHQKKLARVRLFCGKSRVSRATVTAEGFHYYQPGMCGLFCVVGAIATAQCRPDGAKHEILHRQKAIWSVRSCTLLTRQSCSGTGQSAGAHTSSGSLATPSLRPWGASKHKGQCHRLEQRAWKSSQLFVHAFARHTT